VPEVLPATQEPLITDSRKGETEGDRKRQHTSRESTAIERKVRTERIRGDADMVVNTQIQRLIGSQRGRQMSG
jgi:hypothetical protein